MHSLLPTPFHPLPNLSRLLGISLWCKRDDMTGFALGGNKTRKLDRLIEDARRLGATDIVAVGGLQSNFCRMAAAYASTEGLDAHLVLGAAPEHARSGGNLLLDTLFGARIVRVDTDDWQAWEAMAEHVEHELTSAGRVPYRMPVGGSTPVGAMGYVDGFLELLKDAERVGIEIAAIVHASSSAGTHAGLLAGQALSGWNGRIIAVAVAKSEEQLRNEALELARALGKELGVAIEEEAVIVDGRSIGPGYAVASDEAREAQRLFARHEGIVLDEVYTAKAAAALIGSCGRREMPAGNIVFLHTGGVPEYFAAKTQGV